MGNRAVEVCATGRPILQALSRSLWTLREKVGEEKAAHKESLTRSGLLAVACLPGSEDEKIFIREQLRRTKEGNKEKAKLTREVLLETRSVKD